MNEPAKLFLILGIIFLCLGGLFLAAGKISWIGRLPGDIYIKRENFTFYFPVTTGILLSIILSLLWMLFHKR